MDDRKPQWFLNLPWDIQSYLIREFGPETAWLTTPPRTSGAQVTLTQSEWQRSTSLENWQTSIVSPSASMSSSVRSASETAVSSSPTASNSSVTTASTSTRVLSGLSSMTTSTHRSRDVSSRPVTTNSTPNVSATSALDAPPAEAGGLTRTQKIGLGVGIPLGILGAAALLLGCCLLLRRRRSRKQVNGSERPSSPGFIPHFAFQDKSTDNIEHRAPLNRPFNESNHDINNSTWEDEGYDPYDSTYGGPDINSAGTRANVYGPPAQMTVHDPQSIMAPALYHTHSSNRARGKRTSYSSLQSVAELSEPNQEAESPVLGRQTTPLHRNRRPSLPMVLEIPSVPLAATIKRKPVPDSPTGPSPAAQAASDSLLRPAMTHIDHSGSSSSGLALSTNSSTGAVYHTDSASPISPISPTTSSNPFSNDYSYVEDYGPEYQSGYLDYEDGLYGGNRSLDRYPDPAPAPRRSSLKTEWPLRNLSIGRRNRSATWDRVYER